MFVESTTSSTKPPQIIPEDPQDDSNWIEENPAIAAAIIIAAIVAIAIILYWFRNERKQSSSENGIQNNSRSPVQISVPEPYQGTITSQKSFQSVPPSPSPTFLLPNSPVDLKTEQRPEQNQCGGGSRRNKQTLAVPPVYMVSQRKSAPSAPKELEERPRAPVGWRWSVAGIDEPAPNAPNLGASQGPTVSGQGSQNPPYGFVLSVPVVYRRISYAEGHAVYAPVETPPPYPVNMPNPSRPNNK